MRGMGRHFKNFLRQMVDAVEETASAGNEDSGAGLINERFFFELAFQKLKSFAQA